MGKVTGAESKKVKKGATIESMNVDIYLVQSL